MASTDRHTRRRAPLTIDNHTQQIVHNPTSTNPALGGFFDGWSDFGVSLAKGVGEAAKEAIKNAAATKIVLEEQKQQAKKDLAKAQAEADLAAAAKAREQKALQESKGEKPFYQQPLFIVLALATLAGGAYLLKRRG